jgi:hypothetical protein
MFKLIRNLVLLAAMAGYLAFLPSPARACDATCQSCQAGCTYAYNAQIPYCDGNQACLTALEERYGTCLYNCLFDE